ncbi:helicase C-terminal domain-containing protein [Streptomyces sp. NPDC000983]|uniref:helicase C-terminal domain-containing protein n=1 Tax=Streptomyces sp. NPDC000983 TaxID=3154373 RepID=UPI0033230AB0
MPHVLNRGALIGKHNGSTLATWLSGLDLAALEHVLTARSDALHPPQPRSFGELADRLQRPGAVYSAVAGLTRPQLQVAEALAALGPAPRTTLAALLGATGPQSERELDAVLEALANRALVWPDDAQQLRMAAPLRDAWDHPLGLDAPLAQLVADATSEELRKMLVALGVPSPGTTKKQRLTALLAHHADPKRLTAVLDSAPEATRELLHQRARHHTELTPALHADSAHRGARWALERGLLVQDRYQYGPARMPSEVAFALRGPDWRAPFTAAPPLIPTVPVTAREVNGEATAAATAFAAQAASVLTVCSAHPPTLLKSGGVGSRELSRIAKAAQCDAIAVRLVLETAYAAGLLARDGSDVVASSAYDAWAQNEPAEQLTALLRAWRTLPLAPSQDRDEDGRTRPALAGSPPCTGCVQARDALLTACARLPAGQAANEPTALGQLVTWYRPQAHPLPQDTTPFATMVREAELLGVIARGALSPIGAAVRDDNDQALLTACLDLLPTATRTARFGADLTAVVTGTPSASLATLLDSVADRESGGTASLWRFAPATVRRALDAGRGAEGITSDLASVAVGDLPQPLTYLIHDTARGHGRVRVTSAASVLHSAEPALLTEVMAHRKLTSLALRRLAPTVLISPAPLDKTLAALRDAGYFPGAEDTDGTLRIERSALRRVASSVPPPRAPSRRHHSRADTKAPPPPGDAGRLAAALRATPSTALHAGSMTHAEELVAGHASLLSLADVRQLTHAITENHAVTIDYVAASGRRTVRTISELDLDPPYLYAWCHLREDDRVFALSRIRGVLPD